jgi:hypothetical protein
MRMSLDRPSVDSDRPVDCREADVSTAPDGYAQNCGMVARVQVGKAGMRLAKQIKSLLP